MYKIDTQYTKDQLTKAYSKAFSDENEFKKNLVEIIFSDLSIGQDVETRLRIIKDKKVSISLATEILKYKALSRQERAFIKYIYEDELSQRLLKENAQLKFGDIFSPFLNKELRIGEKTFLLELIPLLKDKIPEITGLLEKKLDEDPELLLEHFDKVAKTQKEDNDYLKFLKLLTFVIKQDAEIFIKILNEKTKRK
jgi:hypothetical protein